MNNTLLKLRNKRDKRLKRVRKKLRGMSQMPRLCVVRTNAHVHVQLIDDEKGVTLGSTSTQAKEFRNTEFGKLNKNSARKIGERIAEIAKEKEIKRVIFDRGRSKYHGIVAEVAQGARSAGLTI